MLIDTHCHIHEVDYPLDSSDTIARAHAAGVDEMICVGTGLESSRRAVAFAAEYSEVYAAIGVHPHDTKDGYQGIEQLAGSKKLVAVGEIGLDYFYNHSPRDIQTAGLKWQIEFALANNLPIIFHVRDAFDDFWPIFDSYQGIRGVIHSFTDNQQNLEAALSRGLYIGLNGISTFTKDETQRSIFKSVPLNRILLETDAPFLTPAPFRGKVNEPAFVKNIAEYHAINRQISVDEIASITTANARALFAL